MEKKQESNPFNDYKDKVDYDYILKGKLPYKLTAHSLETDSDKYIPSDDQEIEALSELEDEIEALFDEDYMQDAFPEIGLGRVYAKLDEIDKYVEITFGISTKDARKEFTIQDLKDDVIEFMDNISANIDGISISGVIYNDEEGTETDRCIIRLKNKGKKEDIIAEVIKEPNDKKIESINEEDLDKLLVNKGKLTYKKEDNTSEFILNDDGMIEKYLNNDLENVIPFSKLSLVRECKNSMREGYKLIIEEDNADIDNNINTDEVENNLQQGIEKVDQLQNLKNELEDKVDKLVNESKKVKKFPSTESSRKKLCISDIADLVNISELLNHYQINWIEQNLGLMDQFDEALRDLFYESKVSQNEPFISIDEYVEELFNNA